MGLDEWLQTASPVAGMSWAVVLAYAFIFLLIGWIAIKLSRADRAKVIYAIVVFTGFVLFLKSVIGYDITGILWDAWLTFKEAVLGGGG